jgi:hypothetical protein
VVARLDGEAPGKADVHALQPETPS